MSKTVDERVVSMRFDNENFEKNAQQSLSTLEKLKNALSFKGASDGLKNVDAAARSVNMSGLESGVKAVETRFSALQVIGVTALARITNQAMAAGEQLIKSLSINQITAGWTKYAEKTTAVQTIMAATASAFSDTETQMAAVNEQLEKLSWFTDETSYNFVDMVSNIGKFTSNNIGLEESVTAMQGIANWAAISGANATEASRAMYNLSQAIGVGAVTAVDWRSIENANMATAEFKQTAIETAAALGKLKKTGDGLYETLEGDSVTVANFRENLNQKWFTNDVLTQTLDKYGAFTNKLNAAYEETGKLTSDLLNDIEAYKDGTLDIDKAVEDTGVTAERYGQIMAELGDKSMEFGMKTFKAAQETKTFAEVIDYTKDAVSSNWMNIFESIFGDYTNAKKFWTGMSEDFYTLFVQPLEELGEIVEEAFGSKWATLTDKITKAGISVEAFESSIRDVAGTKYVDRMIDKYGSLEQAISAGAFAQHNILQKALERIIGPAKEAGATVEKVTQSVVNLEDVVRRVIRGDFGNGQARVEALTKAGYDYYVVQDMVNKTIWGQAVNYEILSEAQLKANGYTEEQIALMKEMVDENGQLNEEMLELLGLVQKKSGRELFTESIQNGLQIIIKSIEILRTAWSSVFNHDRAAVLYSFLEAINSFSEKSLAKLNKNAEKITKTFEGLFSVLNLIIRAVKTPFKIAIRLINKILSKFDLNVWDLTSAFGEWLTNLRETIIGSEEASGIFESLISFIASLAQAVITFVRKFGIVDKIKSKAIGIWTHIKPIFDSINDWFDKVSNLMSTFIDHWKDLDKLDLSQLSAVLTDFKNTVIDNLFEWSTVETKIRGFSDNVSSAFKGIFSGITIDSVKDIPLLSGLLGIFDKIRDFISENASIDTVLGAAIAGVDVYAITKIVKLLGNITDLSTAFSVMISNIGTAFLKLGQYFTSLKGMVRAKTILSIAEAMGLLALAAAALAYVPSDKLNAAIDSLVRLAAVLGTLALAVGGMNWLSSGAGGGLAVSGILLGIAASFWIIISALKKLEKLDTPKLKRNVDAILPILYALGAVAGVVVAIGGAMKKAGVTGSIKVGGAFLGMLAIAGALYIIVEALIKLQNELSGFRLEDTWQALIAMFAMLKWVIVASIPFMFGKWTAGIGLLATVLSLWALVEAIHQIANLDVREITDNLWAFVAIFAILRILMLSTAGAGEFAHKGGSAVLQMAAALIVIAIAMKMIAEMSVGDIIKGVLVVSWLMILMSGIVVLSKFAGKEAPKAGMMLILMAVAIGILAGIMYLLAILAKENPRGFWSALAAVTVLGLIFTAIIVACGSVQAGMKKVLGTLVVITAVLLALAGILYILSTVGDADAIAKVGFALAIVLGMTALLAVAASKASMAPGALASMANLLLVIIALAGILWLMEDMDLENGLRNAEALGVMLLAFSTAVLILSFAKGAAALGPACVGLLELIGTVALVLAALGGLDELTNGKLKDLLERGIPLLEDIASGLGRAIGALISSIGVGLMEGFKKMAELFKDASSIFAEGFANFGDVKPASITACIKLVEMMGKLAGSEIKTVFANIFTGGTGLIAFATNMIAFGNAVRKFPVIRDVVLDSASQVGRIGSVFIDIANKIPKTNGLAQKISGAKDLGKFAEGVASLGSALADFPPLEEKDGENAERAARIGASFAEFASKIPDDLEDKSPVYTTLTNFARGIRQFAWGLAETDAHQGIPELPKDIADRVSRVSEAAIGFIDLANSLPEFKTDKDLATFGEQIASFSESISGITTLDEEKLATIESMGRVANSLTTLGTNLGLNGGSIKTSISGMFGKNGLVTSLANNADDFKNLASALNEVDFTTLKSKISLMSDTINTMVETFSSATGEGGDAIGSLVAAFQNFATAGVNAFLDAISNADSGSVSAAVQTLIDEVITNVDGYKDNFNTAGGTLIDSLKTGVANYSISKLSGAFTSKLSTTVATIRATYYTPFYNVGEYLVEGFIKGIEDYIDEAAEASAKMASEAEKAAKAELEQNSPSKKFIKIGEGTGEGLVLGMENYQSAVAMAGADLAAASLTDVATTLSAVNDIVNSNLDLEPTITPVIDSSSLAYGMDSINSMFSDTKASVLSADISGRIDANSIVLDYIDKLDKANSDRNNVLTRSLDSVRNEIGRLGDRIDQIDMVLDSGELVGAIGPKVDKDLGRRTKFKNRGM